MICSILIRSIYKAHSAYTWDELAEAIRRSYVGINQVLVLKKFINWSESIDPYLSEAAKTAGMCLNDMLHWCAWFCLHELVGCFV